MGRLFAVARAQAPRPNNMRLLMELISQVHYVHLDTRAQNHAAQISYKHHARRNKRRCKEGILLWPELVIP